MTTLAANTKRVFEFNESMLENDVPMVASDIIYEGAAVGLASGLARPFEDGDVFGGFSIAKVDNSTGAASAKNCRVVQRGTVKLTLGGTVTAAKVDDPVYATDDDTFSLTDSGSDVAIGRLSRYISSTVGMVRFVAAQVKEI